MKIIRLDGENWKTALDVHIALWDGLQQGHPHGLSVDAFVDSMVWGGMGGLEPPYEVQVTNVSHAPEAVIAEVKCLCSAIRQAREERRSVHGVDVDVTISCPEIAL